MSEAAQRSRILDEASRWFTVLKRPAVTAEALRDFELWARDGAHAEAFAQVKRTWAAEQALVGDPEIQAATREALAAHPVKSVPRSGRFTPFAVGFAALAVLGAGGAVYFGPLPSTFSTDVGEQRVEVLKDGSRVRLNTDSKIRVRFHGGERHVTLVRGEAFFDVAHDPMRPFIVESGDTNVRALGTRFDVRQGAVATDVTLLQGRVEVSQDGRVGKTTLAPDQAVTITAAGLSAPRAAVAADATGWTTGRLTFRGVPLDAAIAEVNRYSKQKIVLTAPSGVSDQAVDGVFKQGDTATFVSAVHAVFGLSVVARTEREIRLAPPAPAAG